LKALFINLLSRMLQSWAPQLIMSLLARINPHMLAADIAPYIRQFLASLSPQYQAAFREAWHKLATFIDELVDDPS